MKKPKPKRRPGVLVRFYPTDLAQLNEYCAKACTPRENFIRRVVLAALNTRAAWNQSVAPAPKKGRTK